jgi:formamidopyrimidine-DNA glycosylase
LPELPDVEIFRRYIGSTSLHKNIVSVDVADKRILEGVSPRSLENLAGSEFKNTRRIGKYCFVEAEGGWLVMHFGMTGYPKYYRKDRPDKVKVNFGYDNDYNLAYVCTRMLGKISLCGDPDDYSVKNDIGPDILGMDDESFMKLISKKKGKIKAALMDQSLMSGLGNIYTDEVLFQTGIHPETRVSDLKRNDLSELRRDMKKVLHEAIKAGADPEEMPPEYLIPIREKEEKCPRDQGKIEKTKVNGRSTYFCSKHQKK